MRKRWEKYIMASASLDELESRLNEWVEARELADDPLAIEDVDTTSLPTFGGIEPEDTLEVYSWDETRVLLGERQDGQPGFEIQSRLWAADLASSPDQTEIDADILEEQKTEMDLIIAAYEEDKAAVFKSKRGLLSLYNGEYIGKIRGREWAEFGNSVYELVSGEDGNIRIRPAILPGNRVWAVWPDEGHGGIAHMGYLKKERVEVIIKIATWPMMRDEFELWRNYPIVHPDTQAASIYGMGIDPMTIGGKNVDGEIFKPDADPDSRGVCGICGKPGVWIAGGAQYRCAKHQDCY